MTGSRMEVGDLVRLSAYAEKLNWLGGRYLDKIGIVIASEYSKQYQRQEYQVMFTDKTTEIFFRKELKYAK